MEVHGKDRKTWTDSEVKALLSVGVEHSKEDDSGDEGSTHSEDDKSEKIAEDETVSDAQVRKIFPSIRTGQTTTTI